MSRFWVHTQINNLRVLEIIGKDIQGRRQKGDHYDSDCGAYNPFYHQHADDHSNDGDFTTADYATQHMVRYSK